MRKVLIIGIMIFLALIISPLCILPSFSDSASATEKPKKNTEVASDDIDKSEIIKLAASLCTEDFCDEGLKCALAIAKNNFNSGKSYAIGTNTDYTENLLQKLGNLYDEAVLTLQLNEKTVYIPTSSLSKGYTEESEEYPYIISVASPWDCLSEDFIYGKEYNPGISMAGLDYLCKNGTDFKEALMWYLPLFTIKQINSP